MFNLEMKNPLKSYDNSKLIKEKVLYLNNKKDTNKSLILWGTNLHTTVGVKLTQNELNIVKLPYFIKSVIIGILLSDGYIIFSTKSKNGRLGLTQYLSNSAYLYFVFNILAHTATYQVTASHWFQVF